MTGAAALCQMEAETELAQLYEMQRLHERREEERRRQFYRGLVRFWPVGVGFILACLAPGLQDLVAPFQPWGMRLVFPFVVLAGRQEIHLGAALARNLQGAMLYAQFPLEGLLAKILLRDRVTLAGVAVQLLLFHFLAVTEIWLLSGALK